jgi:hypothetical protein
VSQQRQTKHIGNRETERDDGEEEKRREAHKTKDEIGVYVKARV